jgi:hypothetical protein
MTKGNGGLSPAYLADGEHGPVGHECVSGRCGRVGERGDTALTYMPALTGALVLGAQS